MAKIRHRLSSHTIYPETETLIIGTFNPESTGNTADFFYGRQRNFLWTLIPAAFGDNSLKGKSKEEKLNYIKSRKIDFIDLIAEVDVDEPENYEDSYLDDKVSEWTDVIGDLEKLHNLKKICITRKSFADIPNMRKRIEEVKNYCDKRGIHLVYVTTPARFYNKEKQDEWTKFLTYSPK